MNTIIIKVTDSCNLKCSYCYAANENNGSMSESTLKNIISRAASLSRRCHIIWHGGEPLLVGIDFYKKAIAMQNEYRDCVFSNSIQTNGTLLTDAMLDFFEKNDFKIGFSLDGIKECHDLTRPYKTGDSSFDYTLFWMKEVKKRGLGGGGICVLNKVTASNITDIYKFSKQENVEFKYNPLLPEGRAYFNKTLELSSDELAQTYIKLFDLWIEDSNRPNISFFSQIISKLSNNNQKKESFDCSFGNKCQYSFVAVASNGDVYPCGRFVGNKGLCYGNVNDEEPTEKLLDNTIRKEFFIRHEGLEECRECRYLSVCNSGCPNSAYSVYGTIMHKDSFCDAYKLLFNHIEKKLTQYQSREDVFVMPMTRDGNFVIYSPLRKVAFMVNNNAAKIIKNYLQGSNIPQEEILLMQRINQLSKIVPKKPDESRLVLNRDHATIILTNKCNMACSYCFAQSARKNDCMSKESLIMIIDYVTQRKSNVKRFTFIGGGEPTIEWDLIVFAVQYIYSKCKSQKVRISITTNTTLLDVDKVKWIKQNNIHVSVSYDILPDIQNKQRPMLNKEKSSDIVYEKIRLLIENNVSISIRSTITQFGVNRMPEMVDFVHKNFPEIHSIHLESVEDEFMKNAENYYSTFVESFYKARSLGRVYHMDIQNSLTNSLSVVQNRFCPIEMCFTSSGDIVACHRNASQADRQYNKFKYGNFKDKIDIEEKRYNEIIAEEECKFPECYECFAKYHCAGMCASHRAVFTEELRKIYCKFTKRMILRAIEEQLN